MKKSFRYRIYPNKKQEVKMERTLGTCRHTYNNALAERNEQSKFNRLEKSFDVFPWGYPEYIDYDNQAGKLSATKTDFQKEVHSQVLQNVLKRVEKSFRNMSIGFGHPRFKGRNRYNSFTYPGSGFSLKDNKLSLSKIGLIPIILHRSIPPETKIKTCTIKKDIDQWYVTFSCDIDIPIPTIEIKTTMGIDVGLTDLLSLKNGENIKPPKFLRLSEKRLSREQIKLSKKKPKSHNRNKQRVILSKVHRKIRNQRKDFAHKTSRMLVDRFDLIAFEDLNINGMLKNHNLSKSISDASWYQLQMFTTYKAEWAGKKVEQCNPSGTSQTCICGQRVPKDLSVRIHNCPSCGLTTNRDQMSATIILDRC